MQTGVFGNFAPNCSRIDKLSILICAPIFDTFSISSIETPLGVYIIFSGLYPALIPNSTSWMDTVSSPEPNFLMKFNIEIFDNALQA